MHPLRHYVASSIAARLLVPSPIEGVYWSSTIPGKVAQASKAKVQFLTLDLGDFLVGTYARMSATRAAISALAPGCWSGTEIHHIVENFHLQFLGLVQPIGDATYDNEEPCVLLAKKHHDTHVDGIVGDAERLIMETKPFNFVSVFKASHPGISKLSRTQQGIQRVTWVKAQETRVPPTLRRQEVRETLREIYSFAYQEPDLRPLKLIAQSVIDGMPL